MSGELLLERWQIGRQTTERDPVAATRILYVRPGSTLTRDRDSRPWDFQTGSPDNVRAHTQGPVMAGGQIVMPASAGELLEVLDMTVAGGVSPTTPVGATNLRQYLYKPSSSVGFATLERFNGAMNQRGVGYRGAKIAIEGSTDAQNQVTVDLLGIDRQDNFGSLTGSLTQRTPEFFEGWQTNFYLDPYGQTPGQTRITDMLLGWKINLEKPLERQFTAQNTLSANNVNFGAFVITSEVTARAAAAQTLAEILNWDADTKRILRYEFLGPAGAIDPAVNEVQTLTITGTPTGGTFTLTFRGQTTATIAFDATAAAVQAALVALSTIGSGNLVAAGGPLPGTPVTLTFQGALAASDVPLVTADSTGLTGGTTPTASVAQTTAGFHGGRRLIVDIPGAWTSPDMDQDNALARAYSMPFQYVYDPALAAGLQIIVHTDRTSAY